MPKAKTSKGSLNFIWRARHINKYLVPLLESEITENPKKWGPVKPVGHLILLKLITSYNGSNKSFTFLCLAFCFRFCLWVFDFFHRCLVPLSFWKRGARTHPKNFFLTQINQSLTRCMHGCNFCILFAVECSTFLCIEGRDHQLHVLKRQLAPVPFRFFSWSSCYAYWSLYFYFIWGNPFFGVMYVEISEVVRQALPELDTRRNICAHWIILGGAENKLSNGSWFIESLGIGQRQSYTCSLRVSN